MHRGRSQSERAFESDALKLAPVGRGDCDDGTELRRPASVEPCPLHVSIDDRAHPHVPLVKDVLALEHTAVQYVDFTAVQYNIVCTGLTTSREH